MNRGKQKRIAVQRPEFLQVYAKGKQIRGRCMHVFVMAHGEQNPTRLGLCTPRKVGNAVQRNLVRRRMREIFRAMKLELGYTVVINFQKAAVNATYEDLQKQLQSALHSVQILKDGSHDRTTGS